MDFVGSFPEEVTDMILSLLSANDLENCSSVSQLWSSTIKRFQQQQISRLKYNWENGKYSVHCFPIRDEFLYSSRNYVEVIPSYDQVLHYPAFMLNPGTLGPLYFYIVRIDAELRKTINLCQLFSGISGCIKKVWVMGDTLIFFIINKSVGSLHYCNASLSPNTKMKTIDEWSFFTQSNSISLRMDRNYIAVSSDNRFVKAWCKQTLELKLKKLEQKCSDLQHISLFDGCLVISNAISSEPTSVIEIHNLKSDSNNGSTLKHTFTVDGKVYCLHSNKQSIFLSILLDLKFILQVRNKQSYSIIYSCTYDSPVPHEIQSAYDDYIVVLNDGKYRILNLITRKWSYIPSFAKNLRTVFDNIAVIRNQSDKTLQVFDWKRNTQLLTLAIPEQISYNYVIASVTESRIVILDISSNQVVVFKFG